MAAFEQIKDEYPVRLLLEGKTKAGKFPVGRKNTRRITMMNSIGSMDSINAKIVDELMAQT